MWLRERVAGLPASLVIALPSRYEPMLLGGVDGGMKPGTTDSKAELPRQTESPSETGLANEVRPGLGTRKKPAPTRLGRGKTQPAAHDHEPAGRDAPLVPREPQEQPSDSMAHELERDSGVSGHSGGT